MADVYLNGRFMPMSEARVPVMDRGFLFGDGVYEVLPVYGGHIFRLEHHLRRLDASLSGIRVKNPLSVAAWHECLESLVERNGGGDLSLYMQVTRGVVESRDHGFDEHIEPTVFAMASVLQGGDGKGVAAITLEDIRWRLCNIKAITLLPNVLLRQQARDAGAYEAILYRDGMVTEGAASNVFVVINGEIRTPTLDDGILPGITRDVILEIITDNGLSGGEQPVTLDDLRGASEIWVTSSTREIVPIVRLDGQAVGSGETGPVFARMTELFARFKQSQRE